MNKLELNIIDLLEYLQEMLDSSAKMPITGKVMVDKKEFKEVIDQVINYLPDQLKKAEWVINEKDIILSEAQKEFEIARRESAQLMKEKVENHDLVKEAKIRANEIIALAQRDAKAIRVGFKKYSKEIDEKLSDTGKIIKENIAELRNM